MQCRLILVCKNWRRGITSGIALQPYGGIEGVNDDKSTGHEFASEILRRLWKDGRPLEGFGEIEYSRPVLALPLRDSKGLGGS